MSTNTCRWGILGAASIARKNWLAAPWPKEYGGLDASPLQQMIFNEAMSYRRIPAGNMGVWWVGPALMLTADAGSFITGHVVFADGGMVPN